LAFLTLQVVVDKSYPTTWLQRERMSRRYGKVEAERQKQVLALFKQSLGKMRITAVNREERPDPGHTLELLDPESEPDYDPVLHSSSLGLVLISRDKKE